MIDRNAPGSTLRGRQAVALVAALLVAVLSFQLNASMIAPVLPDMARVMRVDLGMMSAVASWFFLSGAIAGLVLARWADRIGRKPVLVLTVCLLLAGTLLCAVATSFPTLIVGRVLQGASSAVFQLSYVTIRSCLSAEAFAVAIGTVTAINGGVGGLDGYLAGYLNARFGFRSIFVLIFVVAVVALIGVLRIVPRDPPPARQGRMDWVGSGLFAVCLIAATQALAAVPDQGWVGARTVAAGAVLVLVGGLFVFWERRQGDPLVPVGIFASRRTMPLLVTTVLVLGGVFSLINFTLVVLLESPLAGFALSPATSALLVLAPPALIGCLAAPVSGWWAARVGWMRCLRIGLMVCLAVLGVLSIGYGRLWVIVLAVAVLGVAYNGLVLTVLNGLGVLLSPRETPAALPGLNGSAFGIGASLGISVVASAVSVRSMAGFGVAIGTSFVFLLLALGASLLIRGGPVGEGAGRPDMKSEGLNG